MSFARVGGGDLSERHHSSATVGHDVGHCLHAMMVPVKVSRRANTTSRSLLIA
jgi:hypothetical protein